MEDFGGAQKAFCAGHFVLALVGPLLSFLPLILIFEESHLEGFVFTALIVSSLSACFLLQRKGLILSTLMLSLAVYLSDLQTLSLPCLWAAFSISLMVSTYSWQELRGIFSHFLEELMEEKRLSTQSLYTNRASHSIKSSVRPALSMALQTHAQEEKKASETQVESSQKGESLSPSVRDLKEAKDSQDPKIISLKKLLALTQHQLKKEGEKNREAQEKMALLEKHFEEQNYQVSHLSSALQQRLEQKGKLVSKKEESKEIKALKKELFEKQLALETAKKKASEKALDPPAHILEKKLKRALEELSLYESQEKRLLELVTSWSRA